MWRFERCEFVKFQYQLGTKVRNFDNSTYKFVYYKNIDSQS